jgi:hypothetical protein
VQQSYCILVFALTLRCAFMPIPTSTICLHVH